MIEKEVREREPDVNMREKTEQIVCANGLEEARASW